MLAGDPGHRRGDRADRHPAHGRDDQRLHGDALGPPQAVHLRRRAARRRLPARDRHSARRTWRWSPSTSCSSSARTSPRARSRATCPTSCRSEQVGLASGLMGTMIVLGTIAGVGIATFGGQQRQPLRSPPLALGRGRGGDDDRPGHHRPTRARRRHGARSRGSASLARHGRPTSCASRACCGCSLVRLLFLGAYAATSLALRYFQRAHGMTDVRGEHDTVFIGTAIVGVMTAHRGDPRSPDLRPGGAKAGHLGRGGHRGDRPARRGAGADSGRSRSPRSCRSASGWAPSCRSTGR